MKPLGLRILKKVKHAVFKRQNKGLHSWEYYNRVSFVKDQIMSHNLNSYSVLDIGGATGNNLLNAFGVQNVTTVDLLDTADIVAGADRIPVDDKSYDFVTCIDTLEHIPQDIRITSVNEFLRIARKQIIIVAPIDTVENNRAEQLVLQYDDNTFLKEHQIHGLVDFVAIETFLKKQRTRNVSIYPLDNLSTWVCLMLENRLSANKVYQEAHFLENSFHPRRKALVISL